ncbi:type II toxin-antitoxin system HicA family toxin [Candidatus Poribacteria bacterium]|nr:type II toxin-antitoxin system HicA family toxin [Candidatus Poribacteria bacterium]
MPPLSPLKRRQFIRKLRCLGFNGPYPGGRHQYMRRGQFKIRVPNPHDSKEVGIPIIRETLNQLGISEEQWNEL